MKRMVRPPTVMPNGKILQDMSVARSTYCAWKMKSLPWHTNTEMILNVHESRENSNEYARRGEHNDDPDVDSCIRPDIALARGAKRYCGR